MLKRLEVACFALSLLLSVAHAQDGTLRQWQAVQHLEPSLVSRQLPVYLDGTIAFSKPEGAFFVLGDPHEGIPVHVIGPYPDIKVGDRVHIEGTTMHLLQQPGVRLVAWKKYGFLREKKPLHRVSHQEVRSDCVKAFDGLFGKS